MRERSDSGLSIKAFCKNAGFHENVYYYWQRKLREAACEKLTELQTVTNHAGTNGTYFAEVQLAQQPLSGPTGQLHAEIQGIRITADSAYPADKLAELLRWLSQP